MSVIEISGSHSSAPGWRATMGYRVAAVALSAAGNFTFYNVARSFGDRYWEMLGPVMGVCEVGTYFVFRVKNFEDLRVLVLEGRSEGGWRCDRHVAKVGVATVLGLVAQYPLAIMVYNAHGNRLVYPILCTGCEGAFSILSLLMSVRQRNSEESGAVGRQEWVARVVGALCALYFTVVNGSVVYDALRDRGLGVDLSFLGLVSVANLYLLYDVCKGSAMSLSTGGEGEAKRVMPKAWYAGRAFCFAVALLSCGTTGVASGHMPKGSVPYLTALAPLSALLILYKPLTDLWDLFLMKCAEQKREETPLLQ